jgi:poly(3-hydroxybutyrate) depolymerase
MNGNWQVMSVDGKKELVRPQDIKGVGLLTIEGELDDISGSGQTKAAHTLCKSIPSKLQMHFEVKGAGHYGIFSGRRWREQVYPLVTQFILENDTQQKSKSKLKREPSLLAEDFEFGEDQPIAKKKITRAKAPAKKASRKTR